MKLDLESFFALLDETELLLAVVGASALIERELAAILAALRDGPEQPPTPDRTFQNPGNGHGPPVEHRRCPVCRRPYEVRATDRPGWVQVRCGCRDGAWNWVRTADLARTGGRGP